MEGGGYPPYRVVHLMTGMIKKGGGTPKSGYTPKNTPFFQNFRKIQSLMPRAFFRFPGGGPGKVEKWPKNGFFDQKMGHFEEKMVHFMTCLSDNPIFMPFWGILSFLSSKVTLLYPFLSLLIRKKRSKQRKWSKKGLKWVPKSLSGGWFFF